LLVAWVTRHPWLTLLLCTISLAGSIRVSVLHLGYRTQRDDLMSAHKECRQRWQRYISEFGADDDAVVVVEGGDRRRMEEAIEAVAAELRARPDQFDRVFWKVDLTAIRTRSLLLMPFGQLRLLREQIASMGPLLGPLAPVAWNELTLGNLLVQARAALADLRAGQALSPADRGLLEQLPAMLDEATALLGDGGKRVNPWKGFLGGHAGQGELLDRPLYFFSGDGTLAFVLARPVKSNEQSFRPASEAVKVIRSLLDRLRQRFPDLAFGLTGLPVLENDEMAASDEDTAFAQWLALGGVGLLYLIVYRGLRYPFMTVATLLAGTVWALGLTTMTIGYLTIISATFAVMLIGMGDYGVLWVMRFQEERKRGLDIPMALRNTAERAGPSIFTAAATAALAFYATMLADFQAVAELGFIAGSGVLLCALACFTLMPALLVVVHGRRSAAPPHDARAVLPVCPPSWLPVLAERPRWVIAMAAALGVLAVALAARLGYDHNLLHMQAHGLESVRWEEKLLERTTGASWHALSIAESPEAALALKARYEQLPEVSRVAEIASLVPADQRDKVPLVRELHGVIRWLPEDDQLAEGAASYFGSIQHSIAQLLGESQSVALPPLAQHLSDALANFSKALSTLPADTCNERLQMFDRRLRSDLRDGLQTLRDVSTPEPIRLDDLPPELRERLVSPSGKWLLRVYAREDLWEYDALQRFVDKCRAIDPEVTGKPFGTLEGLQTMKAGFLRAGLYAVLAIVAVLTLDLGCFGGLCLALVPLALGLAGTLGFLSLCGLALNPANLIALPLIVGVGVDNGIHLLHDYRLRDRGRPYLLCRAIGRGILVKALTTLLGFGTLMVSRHQGLFGLGLALTLGVGFSMVGALVVLPAVLNVLSRRRRSVMETASSRSSELRHAA
jgi:hopanoid biosynthesis associated RND transporter like protein HpnN